MDRQREWEEWLTRAEMERLLLIHAFHAYIAESEHLVPDHESAQLRDVTPAEVTIMRDDGAGRS